MVKARKYIIKNQFQGLPKREDFEIVEIQLPSIKNGEILIKTEWLSVDPYQRSMHGMMPVPYDQFGFQVAVVEDSKDPRYPVGTRVVAHKGWCDYCVVNPTQSTDFFNKVYKLPNLKGLSPSLGLSAIGPVGATAYFGLLDVCQPKAGETVVVSGAAGAVGSLVGQIAKIKGCKVIGFCGTNEKVRWLESDLGFDKAFNYKDVDIVAALKEAAPGGVNCYFDNVGGEISSSIISQMSVAGRVAVCGSVSAYNADKPVHAAILQPHLVTKQLRMQGFTVANYTDRWPEAFAEMTQWISSGLLKPKEHVTEGFENVVDAFVGMLRGENYGKAVVKL